MLVLPNAHIKQLFEPGLHLSLKIENRNKVISTQNHVTTCNEENINERINNLVSTRLAKILEVTLITNGRFRRICRATSA